MRVRTTALCALVVALMASTALAGDYNAKTLIGTWDFDVVGMLKASGKVEAPPGQDLDEMLKGMSLRITFNKDGTYLFQSTNPMGNRESAGTWEIKSSEGNKMIVRAFTEQDGEMMVTMIFKDKDHFESFMEEEADMPMLATRVKPGSEKKAKSEG